MVSTRLLVMAVSAPVPEATNIRSDLDVLIVAGGLTQHGTIDEIALFGDWLRSLPATHKIVVAGGTEPVFDSSPELSRRALGTGFHFLENESIEIQGKRFFGYYGHPNAAPPEYTEETVDVFVSWSPPANVFRGPAEVWEGDPNCTYWSNRLEPRFHVFGGQDRPGTVAPLLSDTSYINCYRFPWAFHV